MPSSRRVFLNPCDYLLYTDHVLRMRRRQGPNIAFMCLDIDGELEPERMRQSIAGALAHSPTAMAKFRRSVFGGWPFWLIPADPHAAAERSVDRVYQYVPSGDGDLVVDGDIATTGEDPQDLRNGPQIRMTHYALPNGGSRVCIRWPHWLMDAAGTMGFLAQWAACYDSASDAAPGAGDTRQWRPLADVSWSARWRALRSQPAAPEMAGDRIGAPFADDDAPVQAHRVTHHTWDADAMERVRLLSKERVPAGPARITRYLGVCVVRALDRLFEENGWSGDAYRITLPMRMRSLELEDELPELRFGNYLVSPLLVFDRTNVSDWASLPVSLTQQLQAYLDAHGDLAQWTLMSLAALLPFPAHRWIFSSRMFKAHFSSGFSFYGEHHPPLRSVGGLPITNLWGGGPTTIPPGMNPVFSRFDKSLNLALTYSWPIVSDEIANRYVELIQREALG
ncbi:MAG: hypothetical protein KDA33_15150 [Phycisphaerales bacterium]|nr:hypothetical protein [Phycisphaerales bacterium]